MISSESIKAGPFLGNGATTSFVMTYKVFASSDLVVIHTDAAGTETTLVLDSDYSVTLNGDQEASPGGSITYPISGSPLPNGEYLTIYNAPTFTQLLDLVNGGSFRGDNVETALDKVTVLVLRLKALTDGTMRLSPGDVSGASTVLPAPEANAYLGWDSGGTALRNYAGTSGVPVSTFMQTFVDDASATEALTTLGFSTYLLTLLSAADAGALRDLLLGSSSVTITPSSDADVTLSATQATYGRLVLATGSWASGHNIIVPTNQRRYFVYNGSAYSATVKTAAGTGIAVAAGKAEVLICDGTNVVRVQTALISGTKAEFDAACSDGDFVYTDTLATDTAAGIVELATTAEVTGVRTTGTITTGTAALTVASGTGITNGMRVTGEGITPGTYVLSGGGTTSLTLSANVGATLSADPVVFYSNSVVLTPASTAGMLARAWVNFNGTGTVAIRAAYNVTSITDGGTGVYTANVTTALSDANYTCVVTAGGTSTTATGNVGCGWAATYATGSVAIGVSDNNTDTNADFANINVTIFR